MKKRLLSVILICSLLCTLGVPAYGADHAATAAAAGTLAGPAETAADPTSSDPTPTAAAENGSSTFSVTAAQAQGKTCTNLVLFAYFQDQSDDHFSDPAKAAEILDIYNGAHGRSFTSYMRTISGGKFEVLNVFPQYDPATQAIHAVQLPYSSADAAQRNIDSGIIDSVLSTLQLDGTDAYLDLNGDGCVDNLTVILQGGNAGSDSESDISSYDCHKSDYPGEQRIGGKRIATYNILNTDRLTENTLAAEAGLVAHEFLHSLGYPDLYEQSGSSYPVSTWDIMAGTSAYPTWPLAYLRMHFTHWVDLKTVTQSTHLTFSAPGGSGDQAYILQSPNNEHEYFVVEMRRKNETYLPDGYTFSRDSLDAKISTYMNVGEAGLIVYRVDTTVEGLSNHHGKTGIYVFRPQPDAADQRQAVQKAYLSPAGGRTAIGSTDPQKGLQDGALTFADGTNSGIVIQNVANSGDQMVCDVVIPDRSSFDLWEDTLFSSQAAANDSSRTAAVAVCDDTPYLVARQNNQFGLYRYTGTAWSAVGAAWKDDLPISPEISLTVHDKKLYLAYSNRSGALRLVSLDPATGRREDVATVSGGHNALSLCSANGSLYIAADADYGAEARLWKLTGSTLTDLGAYCSGIGGQPQIACVDHTIYVSFRSIDNTIRVYRCDDANQFTCVSDDTISATDYGLVAWNHQLRVVTSGAQTVLHTYRNGAWTAGEPTAIACFDPKLTTVQGNLYMLTSSRTGDGYTYVYQYDPDADSWIAEGGIVDVPSQHITLTASTGHLYLSYVRTGDQTIHVRRKAIANALLSLRITPPSKTVYTQKEPVSTAGLTVTACYQRGERELTAGEYVLSGFDSATVGTRTATVSYGGKTATFSYQVKAPAAVTPTPTPAKPTVLATPRIASVSNTASGIRISWNKVSGAAKYRLFYRVGSGSWIKLTDTAAVTYTWKKAVGGKQYSFLLRCLSADGKTYTSEASTQVQTAPRITAWHAVTYHLNGGVNNKQNPARYGGKNVTLKAPSRKGYVFLGWYTSTRYRTKVTRLTVKDAKDRHLYARWSAVKVGRTSVSSLKNLRGRKVTVRYRKVAKASGYQIVYATKRNMKGARSVYVRSTAVTLKKLQKNKTYYIKVRAYRKDSTGRKVYGKYTAVRSIRVRK